MIKKFWKFSNTSNKLWKDWKWQLKNRLDDTKDIKEFFPNLDKHEVKKFNSYISSFKLKLTPYLLSLIELDRNLNPKKNDPIWNQFCALGPVEMKSNYNYDGIHLNWELPKEMPTQMLHHKYPDRAIIRIIDSCFSYCSYCYLTKRTLDKRKNIIERNIWGETLAYLKGNPQIRDVSISGGDPLLLSNSILRNKLNDLTEIPHIKTIRLNTRANTFVPYRIDEELINILKKYNVNVFEIHMSHPREMTKDFDEALSKFDKVNYRPLILWRSPLLKGINDSYEILEELFLKLYQRRITPYYLFHFAPYSLGRSKFSTSIKKGVNLMLKLRRRIPGPAFPKYALFHPEGKHDIPLDPEGNSTFKYMRKPNGQPFIKFKNWRGNWVEYPDIDN